MIIIEIVNKELEYEWKQFFDALSIQKLFLNFFT